MTDWSTLFVGTTVGILLLLTATKYSEACNEAICASVVSKCMLTQSCKCDLETCSCCRECFSCLSTLYDECCSCVDLCPKPNITHNPLSRTSHVADFEVSVPDLFRELTAEPDDKKRWFPFTYPVDYNMTSKRGKELKQKMKDADKEILVNPLKPNTMTVNCTVAYMANCNSWNKCRQSCQSMGASSYRWFHDGCCECIGALCINYGINESRCVNCPLADTDDLDTQYDDYGQEDDEQNEAEMD